MTEAPVALEAPVFGRAPAGVVAACTTRAGGVSAGLYASLNLGLSVGDDPQCVRENRRRAAAAAGFSLATATLVHQVHGVDALAVDATEAGRGLTDEAPPPEADALATDAHGLTLIASMADCFPVFLAAADGRAVAVAHAGWRGTIAGVVPRTLMLLRERYGVAPAAIVAAFGPGIGPCCFAVGAETAALFAACDPAFVREGKVDLPAVLRAQLVAAGVPAPPPSPPCTRCGADRYFSHRAAGGKPAGRMWAAIRRV
jgi:YfiH family protein